MTQATTDATSTLIYSPADVLERTQSRLTLDLPEDVFSRDIPKTGDHNLNRAKFTYVGPGKPAAVMIPVIARPEGVTVLLTLRTSHLRAHPGQIAFPGGRMDPEDVSPAAAAFREAMEEIGLKADYATALGYLDAYQTGTGYRVIPLVAMVQPGFELIVNPDEVDATFEVPLEYLMQPDNQKLHHKEIDGVMRSFYAFPFGERYIWGVTAGILHNFYERLYL
jgi:8-oxo-dGTP pyrophosphatase MutT (NUDIX family)